MLVSQKTPLSRHRNLFAITFALVASLALTNCAEKEDKESAAAEPVTIPEASTVVVDSEPEEVHPAEAELTEAGCSFLTLFQVDGSTSYLLNCQDVHSEQEIQAQINALSSFVEKAKPESTPENTEEPAASEEENSEEEVAEEKTPLELKVQLAQQEILKLQPLLAEAKESPVDQIQQQASPPNSAEKEVRHQLKFPRKLSKEEADSWNRSLHTLNQLEAVIGKSGCGFQYVEHGDHFHPQAGCNNDSELKDVPSLEGPAMAFLRLAAITDEFNKFVLETFGEIQGKYTPSKPSFSGLITLIREKGNEAKEYGFHLGLRASILALETSGCRANESQNGNRVSVKIECDSTDSPTEVKRQIESLRNVLVLATQVIGDPNRADREENWRVSHAMVYGKLSFDKARELEEKLISTEASSRTVDGPAGPPPSTIE